MHSSYISTVSVVIIMYVPSPSVLLECVTSRIYENTKIQEKENKNNDHELITITTSTSDLRERE